MGKLFLGLRLMVCLSCFSFNTDMNLIFLDLSCMYPVVFANIQMWPFPSFRSKNPVSLRLVNSTYLIKWHENVPKPTVLEFFIQKYHSIFQLLQNSFFTSHKSSSQVWGVQFDIQLITNSILCYSDHCSDCGNRSDVFCSSGGDSVIRVCSRKSASQTAHCLLQGHNVHVLLQTYFLALILKCTYQL